MIDVTCSKCGEVYHADPVHVGKQIRCRRCSSLLAIPGAGGAILDKPAESNVVRQSKPPHSSRRTAVRLGSIIAPVVVIAAALVILLWDSSPDQGTASADQTGVSQTSLGTRGGTLAPPVNPDNLPMAGQKPLAAEQEPQYEVVEASPCDERAPHSSMPNGSRIVPDVGTTGYGVLDVQNGTSDDAVLSLSNVADDAAVREVYVQAGQSVRLKGIPRGTYELAYSHGLDWVGDDTFRCGQGYAQFERQFAFTEERNQEGVKYKEITVTLHQVVGGNVQTKRISRQEFVKNHRRTLYPDEGRPPL